MFSLAQSKEGSVKHYFDLKGNSVEWVIPFRRALYEWEELEASRLRILLAAAPSLRPGWADVPCWAAASSSVYSTFSVYKFCSDSFGSSARGCRLLWVKSIPHKVQFFGWLAWKNKVKSAEFLQKIGLLSSNSDIKCTFCKSEPESTRHVLLLCHFSWHIWAAMLKWWGFVGALPDAVEKVLIWWDGAKVRKSERALWKSVPLAVLWSIWKLRNECKFKHSNPSLVEVIELIKIRVAIWAKSSHNLAQFSVNDFIFNMNQIRFCISGHGPV